VRVTDVLTTTGSIIPFPFGRFILVTRIPIALYLLQSFFVYRVMLLILFFPCIVALVDKFMRVALLWVLI